MATTIRPAAPADAIDAKVAACNQAAADSVARDVAPSPDAASIEPAPDAPVEAAEPSPLHEVMPAPEPDDASAQAIREVDPSEPHDFLEEGFKRDQSGAHPVDLSPAEVVASDDAAHTTGKGLSPDGSGANGMVNGDRIPGL